MQSILQLKNIHTQFGTQIIHDDLNLEIYRGEILGIVGGSGSGKSVLLRMMIGLDRPQRGHVNYIADRPEMGILFQNGALISSLTVLENVMIPLQEVAKLSLDFAEELAFMKLSMVGLEASDVTKFPAQLSGGMIKRVALARAIALDPAILFLDEPTAGLDPVGAAGIDELILLLRDKLNVTVVLVTHDLDTLVRICNRVAVLVDHQIRVGKIEEIAHLDHPWVKAYFQGVRGQRVFGNSHGK